MSELEAALHDLPGGFEAIIDDGSNDDTRRRLLEEASSRGGSKRMGRVDRPAGRDLQNDPADLPGMVRLLDERARTSSRVIAAPTAGTAVRRASSWVDSSSEAILADTVRDTGCSLRVMKREIAESLPLEFRGMHRFIPVTARQLGYTVIETPVRHRPRVAGEAKQGWNRAIPGLVVTSRCAGCGRGDVRPPASGDRSRLSYLPRQLEDRGSAVGLLVGVVRVLDPGAIPAGLRNAARTADHHAQPERHGGHRGRRVR